MNIPEINFPNLDPNFIEDPYPHLKTLRESSPLHKDLNSDLVLVTRFEDVKGVQTSKAFSSSEPEDSNTFKRSNESSENYPYFWKTEEFSLLNLEGQLHGDLRGLVAKAFSTRQVQELRPFMEAKSEELLNNLRGNSFDLLADYAQPYSVSVIGKLLGVPEEQYDNFLDWSNKIVKMYDLEVSSESSEEAEQAAKDFYYYISELIDIKSKDPDDDMISRLSQVTENNQKLTKDQIICTVILLLNAGHEATVNTIGNSIVALNQNNISTKNLNTRYEIKKIIEELIRWDSPLQFFQRYVLEDTEIDNYKIPKGSKVAILLGSANRDPEVFDNPSELNFDRENKDHSSWGGGIHFCIGAHLARLELEVSFKQLLSQNLNLITEPERTGAFGIRGYKNLLVKAS